jgi:biopolymer transport protein ExbD
MSGGKKVRWKKMKKNSQEMALNITSMADIFTIILVFLLKSFSAEGSSLTPNLRLQLPSAKRGAQVSETLKVEISADAIQIDGKVAAKLSNFEFDPNEVGQVSQVHAGIDQAIAAVRAKHPLPKQADAAQAAAQAGSAAQLLSPPVISPADTALTVMADQKTPYHTLSTVLASAANHGYTAYRLIVVKEEE